MNINMHGISTSINIAVCLSIEDIHAATQEDADLQKVKSYIIQGWSHKKDEVEHGMMHYWPTGSKLESDQWHYLEGQMP